MLENLKISKRKYPCAIKEFYDSLEAADQEILMSVLTDSSISHKALEKALKEQAGTTFSDTTIARHRTGYCSCSRI